MNKFERKLEKFAIKNLIYYIILIYMVGTIIWYYDSGIYFRYLALDFEMIAKFQIWRFITFMMFPMGNSIIFSLLILYIYYICGKSVEYIMGTVRFNIFIFSGIILIILSSFIYYLFTGISINVYNIDYLNTSILLMFALLRPEERVMLYFLVPVKAKWFAILILGFFGVGIITGAGRIEAIATLINVLLYILFFEKNIMGKYKTNKIRKNIKFDSVKSEEKIPRHKCCICGKDDITHPELEFRYCSKCSKMKVYCSEHIHMHEHN